MMLEHEMWTHDGREPEPQKLGWLTHAAIGPLNGWNREKIGSSSAGGIGGIGGGARSVSSRKTASLR
jgi:hypothetical protein